jgi:hypothetical protein
VAWGCSFWDMVRSAFTRRASMSLGQECFDNLGRKQAASSLLPWPSTLAPYADLRQEHEWQSVHNDRRRASSCRKRRPDTRCDRLLDWHTGSRSRSCASWDRCGAEATEGYAEGEAVNVVMSYCRRPREVMFHHKGG